MEKTVQNIIEENQVFKRLKPDEQKRELESLELQSKGAEKEICTNSRLIEKAQRDLESAEEKSEAIRKEYVEMRERRQNAVALGEDDTKFKASISDLNVEQDLLEDRCIGLRRRIENLTAEGDLLEQEKIEVRRKILRFRLILLVPEANRKAKEYADVLKEMVVLSWELGEYFPRIQGGPRGVYFSEFEAVELIAKFYTIDELDDPKNRWPNGNLKDTFNLKLFEEELLQERTRMKSVDEYKEAKA
jgi:hypothetical protein